MATASSSKDGFDIDRTKSPNDSRQYRWLELENGLQVILVHDPKIFSMLEKHDKLELTSNATDSNTSIDQDEDEIEGEESEGDEEDEDEDENDGGKNVAAGALAVGVGSWKDPPDMQGLAHYCEHMIFMGSDKYPSENGFEDYLSKNSGYSNAMTECEYTVYQMECSPISDVVHKALDMWANLFLSPLMLASAQDRELQAVDSEFHQSRTNDSVRLLELWCRGARKDHPYNRFTWGNEISLRDEPKAANLDVREELIKFRKKYYVSHLMRLCLVAGQDLDTLERWVRDLFSPLQRTWTPSAQIIERPSFGKYGLPWSHTNDKDGSKAAGLGNITYAIAVEDNDEIHLSFPLPSLQKHYGQKPSDLLGHLVGHESEGSLLSLFKSEGWATDITAGCGPEGFESSSAAYVFTINISLTRLGLQVWPKLIACVYFYIHYLQRMFGEKDSNGKCALSWVYDEYKATHDMTYRFRENQYPTEYAESLAVSMLNYPPLHVLDGDYHFDEALNVDLVQFVLSWMRIDNSRIDIMSKSFAETPPHPELEWRTEKWLGTQYKFIPFDESMLSFWRSDENTVLADNNGENLFSQLAIPLPNTFIPTNFDIVADKEESSNAPCIIVPVLIHETTYSRLWHKMDSTFKVPKANLFTMLWLPQGSSSPFTAASQDVFCKLLISVLC